MSRQHVGFFLTRKNEMDAPLWRRMLGVVGVETSSEESPVFHQVMPRKPRNGEVTFDMMTELNSAIASLRVRRAVQIKEGGVSDVALVVPNFGHFATPDIWRRAAPRIFDLGAVVISADPRREVRDVDTGLEMMGQRRGRTMTERKEKSRMTMGRPKKSAAGGRKERIIRMYGQREDDQGNGLGAASIAKLFGMSESTLKRRMREWVGTDNRTTACDMADRGEWPPKRKLK